MRSVKVILYLTDSQSHYKSWDTFWAVSRRSEVQVPTVLETQVSQSESVELTSLHHNLFL